MSADVLLHGFLYYDVSGRIYTPLTIKTLHSAKTPQVVCGGVVLRSSTRQHSPWVHLRWSLRVDAWNVIFLRDGDRPGICFGDGQMEASEVLVESRHSDMLWPERAVRAPTS